MIEFEVSGSTKNTEKFLEAMSKLDIRNILNKYGKQGVDALAAATPADSGLTAASWNYDVRRTRDSWSIIWSNSHVEDGTPVVIWLQYGHATGTGGWVQGRNFINPALQPIFDRIADDVWKVVTSA